MEQSLEQLLILISLLVIITRVSQFLHLPLLRVISLLLVTRTIRDRFEELGVSKNLRHREGLSQIRRDLRGIQTLGGPSSQACDPERKSTNWSSNVKHPPLSGNRVSNCLLAISVAKKSTLWAELNRSQLALCLVSLVVWWGRCGPHVWALS